MENASKALIIAGAILLSILIISLGIMVYNNAKNAVGNADLSEQEIQAFNAKFTSYLGSGKTAAQVNSLLQTVVANNGVTGNNKVKVVKINSGASEICINGTDYRITNITSGTYTVKASYSNGMISEITIQE